jgi:hypothetical protein
MKAATVRTAVKAVKKITVEPPAGHVQDDV